jgi:hypothetical protein
MSYSDQSETRGCFITIPFYLCFMTLHQEGLREKGVGIEWDRYISFLFLLMVLIYWVKT